MIGGINLKLFMVKYCWNSLIVVYGSLNDIVANCGDGCSFRITIIPKKDSTRIQTGPIISFFTCRWDIIFNTEDDCVIWLAYVSTVRLIVYSCHIMWLTTHK